MIDHMLTRREVESRIGLGRSSIYQRLKDGSFPQPVRYGSRTIRWKESQIIAWLKEQEDASANHVNDRERRNPDTN
ncbi:MAG: AlpA family phage regulatory protein [Acetobacter sp.]|uniref:helix-turn-helix transcriptional regulator n=1 Tax=Acetobacter sp. TaxID=440 RepID=UPI0039ECD20F